MTLTKEDRDKIEEEMDRRERFLYNHGWSMVKHRWDGETEEVDTWKDPFHNYHRYQNGYDQLTLLILRKSGWRQVIEFEHIKFKEEKVQKWARYQSPHTKKLYTFLDAQHIMEQNWDESGYPEKFTRSTKLLNDLVGENFTGDLIRTRFHRNPENKEEFILSWELS